MTSEATILLVEDDQSMLDGMRDLLMAADIGFNLQVMTANDGQVGLEQMAQQTPDLILSDIMMPRMDGYELLRKVRASPAWIHIPFIFLTAKGEKKDIHEGRRSGADLYIVKPFDSGDLLELIQSQLTRSFRLRETRRRNVEDLKKNILQILNHEFRTPLTYVTAYFEMLADSVSQFSSELDFREYLRGIQTGCVRLSSLVDDLVQVIELRTGETEAAYREGVGQLEDLATLVNDVVREFESRAAAKAIHLVYEPPSSSMPMIYGDRDTLSNLFGRLIDNAIKFSIGPSNRGNEIRVNLEAVEDEVRMSVHDRGIGLPERIQPRVFELFYQHNRDVLEQQGAGVGLTIAKGLAELHSGRIELDSQEGVGSTFTVILPVDSRRKAGERVREEPLKRATVLIVEDDRHLLLGLEELLEISTEKYEYETLIAANGQMGLDVLSDHQPDLIISDIMMPKMGGFEFLQRVRENPDWVEIPFIFLTAKGEQHEIHDGLRSGVEEYITKPYESDELLELVSTQLDRHFKVQDAVAQDFESLKRSILSLITPDFRLPLSSVTEYSTKLAQSFGQAETEADLKQSLHGIQESSLRLARLVEDFIALAELKTGEAATAYELNAGPIKQFGHVLTQVGHHKSSDEALASVRIHHDISAELPTILGNATTIVDSLNKLIETGVRHFGVEADGEVTLSAEQVNDEVRVSIRFRVSPGEGALELASTVLESEDLEIQQTHHFAASLLIAKGHVNLHGGRIEVGQLEGGNCSFDVYLPRFDPETTSEKS